MYVYNQFCYNNLFSWLFSQICLVIHAFVHSLIHLIKHLFRVGFWLSNQLQTFKGCVCPLCGNISPCTMIRIESRVSFRQIVVFICTKAVLLFWEMIFFWHRNEWSNNESNLTQILVCILYNLKLIDVWCCVMLNSHL